MVFQRTICGLLLVLFAASCGSTPDGEPKPPSMDAMLAEMSGQDGRTCIRTQDIRGYGAVDDKLLSVRGRGKKHYLVTMFYRCASLQGSMGVAFEGSFSEVCGDGMGRVLTREESCPIRHIYEFASREEALAAVAAAEARRESEELFPKEQ